MPDRRDDEANPDEHRALGRRAFLRAGAAAATGAAFLRAGPALAFHEVPEEGSSIPGLSEEDACLCEFADDAAVFGKPPSPGPTLSGNDVTAVDKDCQEALGLLWRELALGAAAKNSVDIESPAIRYAITNGRADVHAKCGNGIQAFKLDHYPTLAPQWKMVGEDAATNAAGKTIALAHFTPAWDPVIGTHPPLELPRKRDQAIEVVGTHIWFRFVCGVASKSPAGKPKDIPNSIVPFGRYHSRSFVFNSIKRSGVWKSEAHPLDYQKWNWDGNGACGFLAGKRAARQAHGNTAISEQNFNIAWRQVYDAMQIWGERCQKAGIPFRADGCG
jgi:hypothetical protein